jgi:hypothetical protein
MGFKILQEKNENSSKKKEEFDFLVEKPKWTLEQLTFYSNLYPQKKEIFYGIF